MFVFDLFHRFMLGALVGALVAGVLWITTGTNPEAATTTIGALIILTAGDVWVVARRRREQRHLRDLYERPAYGDDTGT